MSPRKWHKGYLLCALQWLESKSDSSMDTDFGFYLEREDSSGDESTGGSIPFETKNKKTQDSGDEDSESEEEDVYVSNSQIACTDD